jgi:hypothetical protein
LCSPFDITEGVIGFFSANASISMPTLARMFGRREKAYVALGYSITDGEL